MVAAQGYNTYLNNHYDGMDPKRLILLLFDGALKHLAIAREGVLESNPKKRGEGIGKVIDIVTELQSSLDPNMRDESTEFLRGLYAGMLTELTNVSIHNDIKPVDLSISYMTRLKEIWVKDVMGTRAAAAAAKPAAYAGSTGNSTASYGNHAAYGKTQIKSFSV